MNTPTTRLRARLRGVWADQRGLAETVQVIFLAVVVVVFLMVLTLAGRGAEARNRIEHSAESAAQAAALQRTPAAAAIAAGQIVDASLTNCVGEPGVTLDTGDWRPGGVVAVTITCRIETSDLAPLPLPGVVTMTASSAAAIDRYRDGP